MRIVIRADASAQMGSGHIMRCLGLANALQAHATITFVVRYLPAPLAAWIDAAGHQIQYLPDAPAAHDELFHSAWLGVSQTDDGQATAQIMQSLGAVDWLIMDHYALDWRWQQHVRPYTQQLLVIDDLADRVHDCDVLLDQNQYCALEQRYAGKVPAHARLLLGAGYALLRNEFIEARQRAQIRTGAVKRLLVFFGGIDNHNYTGRLLAVLPQRLDPQIAVDVVIGAQHPQRVEIEQLCQQQGYTCHVQTQQMAQLMAQADVAVGAGGSASWERCCLGLPSMAFAIADNQVQLTHDAALQGLLDSPQVDWQQPITVANALHSFMLNPLARERMSRLGWQMVDGQGMARVLQAIGLHVVQIRRATQQDSAALWTWRNHPRVRQVSRDTHEIAWDTHHAWLTATLSNPNRVLLIGELDQQAVGVVRFDITDNHAEVSIYRVPNDPRLGLASALLQAAEQYIAEHYSHIQQIEATVLADNQASHRLFVRAGFTRHTTTYCKRIQRV
jgi:UDP-2,4-diacetamido-2,4,6-trideoxy-beta-L-altropyranose hydrolase